MSFDDNGYIKNTIDVILLRILTQIKDKFPVINLDPSNLVYQWAKIEALETLYQQTLIENTVASMTAGGADGIFLQYHANEVGLFRKDAINATGIVQLTGSPNNSIIAEGNVFSTGNGVNYVTTEAITFTNKIPVTHTGTLQDVLPSYIYTLSPDYTTSTVVTPYTWYTGGVFYSSGVEVTESYRIASGNIIVWETRPFTTSEVYYVYAANPLVINVPIEGEEAGLDWNTGANSITVNTSSLSSVSAVNNISALINGLEQETLEELRYRIVAARKKHFTLDRIKDMIGQIDGVKDARTYQNVSNDRSTLTDWTDVEDYEASGESIKILDDKLYAISYYPSTHIGTLKQFVLRAKSAGNAPPLYAYFAGHAQNFFVSPTDVHSADAVVDRGALIKGGETTWQDLVIPMKYNSLDSTSSYRLYLYSAGVYNDPAEEDDPDAYWELTTMPYGISNWREQHMEYDASGEGWWEAGGEIKSYIPIYKTMYGVPGYTASIVPNTGVDFETELKDEIETMLDWVDGGGYSPICIQQIVEEATRITLDIRADLSIETDFDFTTVSGAILTNVTEYLGKLHPGDDIVYSQIEKVMLNTNGVKRVRVLSLKLNTPDVVSSAWVTIETEIDLPVGDDEYVGLGTVALTER